MKLPVTEIMCAICLFQLRAIQFINNFVELLNVTNKIVPKAFRNLRVSNMDHVVINVEVNISIRQNTPIVIDHMGLVLIREQRHPKSGLVNIHEGCKLGNGDGSVQFQETPDARKKLLLSNLGQKQLQLQPIRILIKIDKRLIIIWW